AVMDPSRGAGTGFPAGLAGIGTAPPLPPLVVGRDRALKELKARVGISREVTLDGERLAGVRQQKGMSQVDLHRETKLSERTIQDIESGRRPAHYRSTVEKIASALKVDPWDLQRPVPVQVLTAVHGWPGVGKTTMAAILAQDAEVASAFPHGVL